MLLSCRGPPILAEALSALFPSDFHLPLPPSKMSSFSLLLPDSLIRWTFLYPLVAVALPISAAARTVDDLVSRPRFSFVCLVQLA
jgi:hypothetical protein